LGRDNLWFGLWNGRIYYDFRALQVGRRKGNAKPVIYFNLDSPQKNLLSKLIQRFPWKPIELIKIDFVYSVNNTTYVCQYQARSVSSPGYKKHLRKFD
jgi:hypothetical protein